MCGSDTYEVAEGVPVLIKEHFPQTLLIFIHALFCTSGLKDKPERKSLLLSAVLRDASLHRWNRPVLDLKNNLFGCVCKSPGACSVWSQAALHGCQS